MAGQEKNFIDQLNNWFSSLKKLFEELRPQIGGLGAALAVLLVFGGLIWWYSGEIGKRPGVKWILGRFKALFEWILAHFKRPLPPSDRLTIAVAHLTDDKEREQEKLLISELSDFEGVETLPVECSVEWPASGTIRERKKEAE